MGFGRFSGKNVKQSKADITVSCKSAHGYRKSHATMLYLPPSSGEFPAFTSAEAGSRFNDPVPTEMSLTHAPIMAP